MFDQDFFHCGYIEVVQLNVLATGWCSLESFVKQIYEFCKSILHPFFFLESDTVEDDESVSSTERYPGHIPTTIFQKALLTAGSAAMALYNPERGGLHLLVYIFSCFQ